MKRFTILAMAVLFLFGVLTGCSATGYVDDGRGYSNVSTTDNGRVNGTNGQSGGSMGSGANGAMSGGNQGGSTNGTGRTTTTNGASRGTTGYNGPSAGASIGTDMTMK